MSHDNQLKIKTLTTDIDMHKELLTQLVVHHNEVNEMWKQDSEHAKQLQSYFIKHWLLYKEELQAHFLYGNSKERFLASQYLLLLEQDGEKIINSLNI
jgi:hypothetical protein